VHRVTHPQGPHPSHEAYFELVVDLVCDDEALGRYAGLPAVNRAGPDRRVDCVAEVGRRHYKERIASSKLEHGLLDQPSRLRSYRPPRRLASRERYRRDALVSEHHLYLPSFDQQRLKAPARKTRTPRQRFDRDGTLRNVGSVFQ